MISFFPLNPRFTQEMAGFIPQMLSPDNPATAKEQLNAGYRHGGGWHPFQGFILDPVTMELHYPEDPPMKPYAMATLRNEKIYLYPHDWVLILQPDKTFEIARMD